MGSDPIVLPLLESLLRDHADTISLVGLYTQPDRRQGRGMKLHENPVKSWALAHGIPVRQPDKPGEEDVQWLRDAGCELLLVMAYGHLLRDALLNVPRLPPLNFHASLLPELRGASPIETAIATGRRQTGVTLMRIVRRMDAGAAMDRELVDIAPDDCRESLAAKLASACVPLFARALPALLAGEPRFVEQDESRATYCRILEKEDSNLDFAASAKELHERSRAFRIWPGTAFDYAGQRIRVGNSSYDEAPTPHAPGTVLESGKDALSVATGRGTFVIHFLQRPGGKMLPAADFLRGMPIAPGSVLESRPMKALERLAT